MSTRAPCIAESCASDSISEPSRPYRVTAAPTASAWSGARSAAVLLVCAPLTDLRDASEQTAPELKAIACWSFARFAASNVRSLAARRARHHRAWLRRRGAIASTRMYLTPQLEAALLRQLARSYDAENWIRFGSKLVQPVLALSSSTSRLGVWFPSPRRIEISRSLVVERPWPETIEVLKHEMAHQFVAEVLHVEGETAHGEHFRRVCEARGIDARAAGLAAAGPADDRTAKLIDRVQKLLALAGSN